MSFAAPPGEDRKSTGRSILYAFNKATHTASPEDVNAQHEEKVATLKAQLQEAGAYNEMEHDNYALRRFLRARNWDVGLAKTLWINSVAWRASFGADKMLDEHVLTPERRKRLIDLFPHGLHGVDTVGRPVLVYRLGCTKLTPLLEEFSELTLQKCHVQLYEFIMKVAMPAASITAGKHIDQLTTVFDLKGLGMWDMSKIRALLIPTMNITRDNYPETLGQVIIINAPMIFNNIFQVGKAMLTVETQRKIQVFGSKYKEAILTLIEQSNLIKDFGGTSDASLGENVGPWQKLIHSSGYDGPGGNSPLGGASPSSRSMNGDVVLKPPETSSPLDLRKSSSAHYPQQSGAEGTFDASAVSVNQVNISSGPSTHNRDMISKHSRRKMGSAASASPQHFFPVQPSPFSGPLTGDQLAFFSPRTSNHHHRQSGDGGGFDAEDMQRCSVASFHTCLSYAESSHLSSYIINGTHVFGMAPEPVPEVAKEGDDRTSDGKSLKTRNGAGCLACLGRRRRKSKPQDEPSVKSTAGSPGP